MTDYLAGNDADAQLNNIKKQVQVRTSTSSVKPGAFHRATAPYFFG